MEKKNLLESGISVELINKEARTEKKSNPPITYMHYYHTRKPLISSRLAISGALLDKDSATSDREINHLFGLDPTLKNRAYKNVPALLLKKIKEKYPEGVTILDPFAGSGMIPFEALRLGINVVALDYNPVAYLIMKATLEYPLKYVINKIPSQIENRDIQKIGFTLSPVDSIPYKDGINLYGDVEKHAQRIFNKLKDELAHFYPTHNGVKPRAYIYAWAIECPTCGKVTPVINSWCLDIKKEIYLNYKIIDQELVYKIIEKGEKQEGNIYRGKGTCLFCSSQIKNSHIVNDISRNDREILLAVYLENGKFTIPSEEDIKVIDEAKQYLKDNAVRLSNFIPIELIADDKRAVPVKKYLTYWYRLFSPRPLVLITNLCSEIRKTVEELSKNDEEYAMVIGTYLSMILTNHIRFNSRSTHWISVGPKLGSIMAMRGINMKWNHGEVNPFIKFSGSLIGIIERVLNGLSFAITELNRPSLILKEKPQIEIYQKSILSWQTDRKFKFIITDPPYADDVPYPELMQFFQVWHSRTVGDLMGIPAIPDTTEELSVNPHRSEEMFETRMRIAIKKLHYLLEDDGILVLFYAHKKVKWWKYLIEALRENGFIVTSTISLMTENKENPLVKGKSSIFHSLLITARKRKEDRKTNIYDVESEIRNEIEKRYPELERIYGKDRTNLLVSAQGIAIEVITQYSEITSFTKNTVDYALDISQRYLIEFFAKNNLKVESLDPTTMIYTWLRHSLKEEIDYSEFNQTLKALGLEEESIGDIIHKEKGKRNIVRLIDFSERGPLEIDGVEPLIEESLIDAVHIALRAYRNSQGGITDAREKIENSRYGAKDIISTIEALSKIRFTKTNYREGEICFQFMQDWNRLHSVPQPRDLTDWTEKKER